MAEPLGAYINRGHFSGNYGSHFFIEIRYDFWQDTDNNRSTVRVYCYIGSTDGYSASGSSTPVYIEGNHVGNITSIGRNSYTLVGYYDKTVQHDDATGTASFTTNASCSTPWNNVGSGSVNNNTSPIPLPTIPRGFSQTPYIWIISADEGSATFGWSTSETCNWGRYHLDGSAGWVDVFNGSGTSGQFTVGGLAAGSGHNVYLECRRQDSGQWNNSNTVSFSVYDYPKPVSPSNFTIGNGATVLLDNPLGRVCTLQILQVNTNTVLGTYSGTYNGWVNAEFKTSDAIDRQYASIPNSPSGTYYAKVTCGSSVKTAGNATYSVSGNEKPTVTTTAVDTNKTLTGGNTPTLTIQDLTGDTTNKTIIKYISNVAVSVSGTGQQYATIASYSTKYNNNTQPGSSYTFQNVENATFTGTATDTRGLSNSSNASGLTLVDYVKLTLENIELYRETQTSNTLKLKCNGNYFSSSFGNQNNSLVFQFRYKASDSSTWSSWATKTMTIGTNTYSFDDSLGNSFDYTKTYDIEFKVADKCMTVTASETAKPGIPVFGIFEDTLEAFGEKIFYV